MSPSDSRITREQLEASFREVTGDVTEEVGSRRSQLLGAGIAAVVLTVLVVFLLGRRSGRKRSAVVEIRRI
jgi:hypothetical protein